MTRLARVLSIGLAAAALAASAGAQPVAPPPQRAVPEDQAVWQRRVSEAREAVEQARLRRTAAENAYDAMRNRSYPVGQARVAIEAERTAARDAVTQAQGDLEALLEEARRAGVPPGWLRGSAASAAAPAASDSDDGEAARPSGRPYETPAQDDD